MIDCMALSDRMPDVAHGTDAWTIAEAEHLAQCAECSAEWRLVLQGRALGAEREFAGGLIAKAVMERVRADREPRVLARIPWRAGTFALLAAAAASVLLVFYAPQRRAMHETLAADTATLGVLPELQGLTESELQSMLGAIAPAPPEATSGLVPHLDELTDAELEQLLRSEGGE